MSQASHISHMLRSHPNLQPAMSSGALKVSVRANGTIVSDTGAAGARSSALPAARAFLNSQGYHVSDIRGGMFRVGQRRAERAGHQDLVKNELLKTMSIVGPATVVNDSGAPGLHIGTAQYAKDFPPKDIEVPFRSYVQGTDDKYLNEYLRELGTRTDDIASAHRKAITDELERRKLRRAKTSIKKRPSAFSTWLDTFVEEKGLDTDHVFTVPGPRWGDNLIPLSVVLHEAKATGSAEQKAIKDMLVKIDFRNGNVMLYFEHLAKALARNYG